ncbi:hypothetical protein SAMN05216464_108102 [Mucilaginibacter pineti]|uniref:DnaJ domain-containing protein n=1 Tax=Mucilaginibacter pineti TaxID=1391627 RepID=A0A1G7ENS2_9SPHI|nr:J domain-containing protein [Mucilaginibacter pineti]SDE65289.1 hypothetical protein SAMN05216464_108102 [Mucilaginibacter pineti]
MQWFKECRTLDEVKALYKKLAKQYHPDLGGDNETMQQINVAYSRACATAIKNDGKFTAEEAEEEIRFSEEYREAIEKIIHLEGITIELVGNWVWVTGGTRVHKDTLKSAGYYFASKKLAWYFRTGEYKVKNGGKKSLDEIRAKYGAEVVKRNAGTGRQYLKR